MNKTNLTQEEQRELINFLHYYFKKKVILDKETYIAFCENMYNNQKFKK